jgi:hypothetical protein
MASQAATRGLSDQPSGSDPALLSARPGLIITSATVQIDLKMISENNTVVAPSATRPIPGAAQVGEIAGLVRSHLKEWSGKAATAFELYLDDNARAATLQREVTLSLALALEAQLEVNRRLNTDIWEIGQKTYKALDGAMNQLAKTFDDQQQQLVSGLNQFATEVHANRQHLLIPGPSDLTGLSSANAATLRQADGFYPN